MKQLIALDKIDILQLPISEGHKRSEEAFLEAVEVMKLKILKNLERMEERMVEDDRKLRQQNIPYTERVKKINIHLFEKVDRMKNSVKNSKPNMEYIRDVIFNIFSQQKTNRFLDVLPYMKYHNDMGAFIRNEVKYYFDYYVIWG